MVEAEQPATNPTLDGWPFIDDWQQRSGFDAVQADEGIRQLRANVASMSDQDESLVWRYLWRGNSSPMWVRRMWGSDKPSLWADIERFSEQPSRLRALFDWAFDDAEAQQLFAHYAPTY
ncbi:MAG: hypothetical protein ACRCYS_04170 [Beijerinckiaceae bacterium]